MSFTVPTSGRNTTHPLLGSDASAGNNGVFDVESPEPGWRLMLICSDEGYWEHVSVRAFKDDGARSRVPNWREMCHVKDLCWGPDDIVMQLHPRKADYVNNHPHVLHLWRPTAGLIPTPPKEFV